MYFESNRTGNAEIFRATRNVGGTFDAATTTLILAATEETSMAVTSDELTMYFSSNATATGGGYDIWMTKRSTTGDGWGTPTHMAALSTSMTDLVSWVSADGCNLYLARDVTGQSSEIYWARKPM